MASSSSSRERNEFQGNPERWAPCTTPLESLEKIFIRELINSSPADGEVFRGRYILLKITGLTGEGHWRIEDEKGDTFFLHRHLGISKLMDPAWTTYVLVKEPIKPKFALLRFMFRLLVSGLILRHRSDWDVISSTSDLLPEVWTGCMDWKKKSRSALKEDGDLLLCSDRYWAAMERYTQALHQLDDTVPSEVLFRNRAEAALKHGLLDSAMQDSKEAVRLNSAEPKNILQLATSYYTAREFEAAQAEIKRFLSLNSNDIAGRVLLEKCRRRISEKSTGAFDFVKMRTLWKSTPGTFYNVADFAGPIEVITTAKYGRGLYATRNVKAGELLLVSKALQFTYFTHGMGERPQDAFEKSFHEVAEVLHNRKDLVQPFFDNYSGGEKKEISVVDGAQVLDNVLIMRIHSENCFPATCFGATEDTIYSKAYGVGIWPLVSCINHACWSNATMSFIADVVILRALQDIPSGEQIFVSHIADSDKEFEVRRQLIKENFGFDCTCRLCTVESKEPRERTKKRSQIMKDIRGTLTSISTTGANFNPSALITSLAEVEKTYELPAHQHPRPGLVDAFLLVASFFRQIGDIRKYIEMCMASLRCLGFVFDERDQIVRMGFEDLNAVSVMVQLGLCWLSLLQFERAMRWRSSGKLVCTILMGDESMFDEFFSDHFDKFFS